MTVVRVWAPAAGRVEVQLAGGLVPMEPTGDRGWHEARVTGAGPGTDYRFVLDGGDALPDPRSPWQPEGVSGPSRLVDHDAFTWGDEDWVGFELRSAVLYELHVGTFTPEGTFEAAIARLDHLVDLGIDAVELMPVAEFPGSRGWGYDGVALYAPHHVYGDPGGLKRLVNACHARRIGVILDVVYNHIGPGGDTLGRFGPYFSDRHVTPWGPALNLDGPGSDDVRSYVIDNALSWFRQYHVDGLRLDAVDALVDTSATHLLEELSERVDELAARLGRRLVLIAESDGNDPRLVRTRDVGGYGMHAVWNDDFHHALHAVLTGELAGYYIDFGTIAHLSRAFERALVYAGEYSRYRRRSHGRHDPTLPAHRYVVYLQNHDQVGNRARGERTSALVSPGRLEVGAALVLTSPFVPLLFQGEEWGATTPFQYFSDHQDLQLARAVFEGRLREFASFGWRADDVADPQDVETFEGSKLRWDEVDREPHRRFLDWYRRLISLRRRMPELSDGRLDRVRTAYDERRRCLVVDRGPVTLACNLGDGPCLLPARGDILLASEGARRVGTSTMELPPETVAVVRSRGC